VRVVVQKYGGSSVADIEKIRAVAHRIAATRAQGVGVVVVVSAMGNTTNELIALARKISEKPDRREMDMLVSVGERISMALLAMALHDLGVPATSLTGSQSGIITDESPGDARVIEVRPHRVRHLLEQNEVVIVAGFQGVSRHREVTTLGRGGSDVSAVVLAAALQAEHCEICSDVDGVWSADPRVVPDAKKLDQLSYEETLALARGGAKVLYEEAVRKARDLGVEIVASSTFGPGAGTRIDAQPSHNHQAAVAGDAQLVRIVGFSEAIREAGGKIRRVVGDVTHVDARNAHGGLSHLPGFEGPIAVVTAVESGLVERIDRVLVAEAAIRAATPIRSRGGFGDAFWWEVAPDGLSQAVIAAHQALG
jgi:aspartate kinase